MDLVDPGAELRLRAHPPGGFGHDQLEDVHPNREVSRCHHADAGVRRLGAQALAVRVPAGRANHRGHPPRHVLIEIRQQGVGGRKVDGHVGIRPLFASLIHPAGDRESFRHGQFLVSVGRVEGGYAQQGRAFELDPLDPMLAAFHGYNVWSKRSKSDGRAILEDAAKRYPVLSLSLDVDGQVIERHSAFVFIGNNAYTMEGFEIGERARLDEGVLNLYVTQRKGRFALLRLALRALFRRLDQARDFDSIRAEKVTIRTRRQRLHVAADGEVLLLAAPLEDRIRRGALRVIAGTT